MKNLKTMFLRKELDFTMVFTIYLYIYTSISTMTNRDSVGYIDNHTHLVMYYLNQLIFVAGLFLNVFFWTRLPKDEHKSLYLKFSAVVFYLGSFVLMLYPSAFSFTVIAPIVHLFLGILGGSVHYFISAALMGTGILGRVIAIGAAITYLLQYIVQIVADNSLLLLVMIISGGITLIPVIKNSWQWIILECLPQNNVKDMGQNHTAEKTGINILISFVLLATAATFLLSYCDNWLINSMLSSQLQAVNAYTWPRLFVIPGYVSMGMIGDHKEGRFMNVSFLAVILWLIMCPVLLSDISGNNIQLFMVIFYIVVGFYMGYIYYMSFSLAPYTGRNMIIVASTGKIIEGVLGVFLSLIPWGRMNTWHIIAIGIMASSVMTLILVRNYISMKEPLAKTEEDPAIREEDLPEEMPMGGKAEKTADTDADRDSDTDIDADSEFSLSVKGDRDGDKGGLSHIIDRLSMKYGLTDREKEVFAKLIFTEDSGQEIADALYISRRVFQKHVASIYEKTGTKSRLGLFWIYHRETVRQEAPSP